ncbi:E3 ubiquitin-protein ligase Mdm2-like isoform X2 [Oscarella lobularis]|uniref:E3 ubiquitin-protein ligase Mdm2-like isoform X2 n=1 Tax=Oscarella lobularis TaxID=121494 RepID=UPI003313E51B
MASQPYQRGAIYYQISRELGFVLQPTIAQRASLLLSLNQLTEHIRLYLVARNLIDESVRPVVVRCGDDPIGKVLGVREFTLVHDTLCSLLLPHCRKVTVQRPDAPAVIAAVAAAAASRARNRDIAATPTPTRPFIVPPSALRPSDSGPSAASRREAARSREEQSRESRPSIEETAVPVASSTQSSLGYDTGNDSDATIILSAGEEQKEEEKEEVEEEEEEEEEELEEDEAEEEEEEEEEMEMFDSQESGIFIERHQQLSQEDTDVPEVNDDNYIFLDDMLTEYEFTEYEPESVSSSDGSLYSDSAESESEQMINAQVGTVDTDVRSSVGVHSATAAAAARTCVVCLTRPVNATITHGVSAHFVCCMRCGRRLARKRKGCPICRKTIESVILTYT